MGNLVAAFSEEQTARLTGVTVSQLRYWASTDFFVPSFQRDTLVGRIYSFRDIVELRVLNMLRNQFLVSLPHLRDVKVKLEQLSDERWTGTRLWVLNRKVVWQEPGSDRPREVVSGQYVVPVVLSEVMAQTQTDIRELNARSAEKLGQVERSRLVNHNDPVIAGTRIRVRAITRFHDAGYTVDQILHEYPDLTEQDVQAALEYGDQRAAA